MRLDHKRHLSRLGGKGADASFDRVDASLPWDKLKYSEPRVCDHCLAARFGSCWVNGLSLPRDGRCSVEDKDFEEWRGRERI